MTKEGTMDFNNSSLILHNQDIAEAEQLEERKRFEVEMHNLISHTMPQFHFDEQSTMNSSITSNEGENSIVCNEASLQDQYREANGNEQLKILYDARVREVNNLNKQLDSLKVEFKEQQQVLKKQVTALEMDNRRINISLTESRNLLVEKTEQIRSLGSELNFLQSSMLNEEAKMKEMQEENQVLQQLNMDFEQQLLVVERGFPLKTTTVDKEFQESQRVKINQLEHSLQQAKEEINRKHQHYKQLEDELKRNICNKEDDILDKNVLINSLSDNNKQLEHQVQECMRVIQDQNENLKSFKDRHLEIELQKIHQNSENVRKDVAEQFQGEILRLNSENDKLSERLRVADTQLKETQRNVEIISSALKVEKQELESKLEKLHDQFNEVNSEKNAVLKKLKQHEDDINAYQIKQASFIADGQLLKIVKMENENLRKKILDLEINCSKENRSIQTSLPYVNNADLINSREQLLSAHTQIGILENQIRQLQEENSQLQVKIGLEQERETLIKKLQEKATEFEKIIQKRQKCVNEMISVGTSTISESNSMLKVQHDTLLYQTEAKLHKKLKKEFDDKLKKVIHDNHTLYKCNDCKELKEQNQKLIDLRQQERNAVVGLVMLWETKFLEFEKDTEQEIQQLINEKAESEHTALHTKRALKDYMDKYKETKENLEKQIDSKFENKKEKMMQINVRNYSVLLKNISKIQLKIQHDNDEIRSAAQKF